MKCVECHHVQYYGSPYPRRPRPQLPPPGDSLKARPPAATGDFPLLAACAAVYRDAAEGAEPRPGSISSTVNAAAGEGAVNGEGFRLRAGMFSRRRELRISAASSSVNFSQQSPWYGDRARLPALKPVTFRAVRDGSVGPVRQPDLVPGGGDDSPSSRLQSSDGSMRSA